MNTPQSDPIEDLIQALEDPRRDVRSRAAYELGKLREERAVGPLIRALTDQDKFVRSWAAVALVEIGAPAVAALLQTLEEGDPAASYYAAVALGEMGDLRAVPRLSQAVVSGEWEERSRAAELLAGLGDAHTLAHKVLSADYLTAAQKLQIVQALRAVNYRDANLHLEYALPDIAELCQQMLDAPEAAVRQGAESVLMELARMRADQPAETSEPEEAPEPGAEKEAPAGETPAAAQSPEPSVEIPAAPAEERKKPGWWDRVWRRA
ncbi:MAG TPA: HEAT repeat domain-containing protein [Chthonomonadaceae bacterium]|nr:HEAT repeat domain-containing protein [Chthonomonadaceae bacterium]